MKHATTRELVAYWNRLRNGRTAPERRDIDPAAIRGILSDTFIIEIDVGASPPRFPLRLSGTRINALALRELKGRPLPDLWAEGDRPLLARMILDTADDAAPMVAGLVAAPEGIPPADLELVLLPLRHQGRTHARMLGGLALFGNPSWIGLLPVRPLRIATMRIVAEEDLATRWSGLPPTPPGPPTRYGRFTVHQGGR